MEHADDELGADGGAGAGLDEGLDARFDEGLDAEQHHEGLDGEPDAAAHDEARFDAEHQHAHARLDGESDAAYDAESRDAAAAATTAERGLDAGRLDTRLDDDDELGHRGVTAGIHDVERFSLWRFIIRHDSFPLRRVQF